MFCSVQTLRQDAALVWLSRTYAPHVQAWLQGCVSCQSNGRLWLIVLSEHGPIKMSTYLTIYRVGDIVDIKANAAQQKGMPHKYYHGYVFFDWFRPLHSL